jgi:predicted transposase YdaD
VAATEPPEPSNPHDALFRHTFARVEHAAAELRSVLPAEILARLDLSTLALEPGSYVDDELSSAESDLLFTVDAAGTRAFVYLLFEHQSSVDHLMPLRVLRYVLCILERHVRERGGGRASLPLPIVLPVVLHHSATGWNASTCLEQLFEQTLLAEPRLRSCVPRFSFLLDDISHLSDEDLRARALGLLPTITLWALRDARHPGRIQSSLSRWAVSLRELARAESGAEALLTIFRYLSLVAKNASPRTILAAIVAAAPDAKDTLMQTLAEYWKDEGRAEGELKGRVEGARSVLTNLLELKFGPLSPNDRARVDAASEAQLSRWAARVLSAASIAETLAD